MPELELATLAARHQAQQGLPPALWLQALRPPAYRRRLPEHRRPALARQQVHQLQPAQGLRLVPELRLVPKLGLVLERRLQQGLRRVPGLQLLEPRSELEPASGLVSPSPSA